LISDTLNTNKNTQKSSFDEAKVLYFSTDIEFWYDYGGATQNVQYEVALILKKKAV
jgi:hypothetical protein